MIDAIRAGSGAHRPATPDKPAEAAATSATGIVGAISRTTQPHAEPLLPDTTQTDSALVAAAKHDLQAFAPLYDRYLGPVYRFCLTRLGTIEAAEDATALVFTKALAALSTCRDAHFRPWLFAIARTVVTDAHRAARPHAPLDAADQFPDPNPSPTDLVLHADAAQHVHALLARLTPEQRDIVELRLAGLTGPEIARALGRSPAAVRVAQFRAYARLRTLLDPSPGSPGSPGPPSPAPSPNDPDPRPVPRKEPTR